MRLQMGSILVIRVCLIALLAYLGSWLIWTIGLISRLWIIPLNHGIWLVLRERPITSLLICLELTLVRGVSLSLLIGYLLWILGHKLRTSLLLSGLLIIGSQVLLKLL